MNNLAAKIVTAMFPQGVSPINLKQSKQELKSTVDHFAMLVASGQMTPGEAADARGKLNTAIDQALSKVEMEFVEGCEEDGDRAVHYDTARHLLVGGNHCEHICSDGNLQSIKLERYVKWQDRIGNLLEFCIQQPMGFNTLPPDVQKVVQRQGYAPKDSSGDKLSIDTRDRNAIWEPINVYTYGKFTSDRWTVFDEVMGEVIPGSKAYYKKDALPYQFLGMIQLEGEPYARSYCEDYEGELEALDADYQVLTEAGAAIGMLKWGIKPGSSASKKAFAEAGNGDIITAEPEDIFAIRAAKGDDMKFVLDMVDKREKRLEYAFLMEQAVRRDAERVTAEEIRRIGMALDAGLGGVYSNQVNTWQRPSAVLKIAALTKQGRMTSLPKGSTKVTVVTGDAGLGRAARGQALLDFLSNMAKIFPQTFVEYVGQSVAMTQVASDSNIGTDGLVKTEDDVAAARQVAQQQATMQNVAPDIVKQGGAMIQNQQQGAIDQQAAAQQQQQGPQSNG